MLTAAVPAGKGTIDAGYEIAKIAKYNFVQFKSAFEVNECKFILFSFF